MMSLWGAVMGGVNLIEHAAGWMEGGLTASFEKLILDAELLQNMREFLKPIVVNEAEMGVDAINEVGPGGHFFGVGHTLARFSTAFYEPMLSDWRNYQTWENAGAKTGTERANLIWKELLRSYEAPPMDEGRTRSARRLRGEAQGRDCRRQDGAGRDRVILLRSNAGGGDRDMTDVGPTSKPALINATPQLFVSDIVASCDFFTRVLGFGVEFVYGEPPFYAQVIRDGASLALRHMDRPVMEKLAEAMKADVDMLAASISVDDVQALYSEFQAAGVAFHQDLRAEAWGARTFIVRDPDGNLLLFAGSAD